MLVGVSTISLSLENLFSSQRTGNMLDWITTCYLVQLLKGILENHLTLIKQMLKEYWSLYLCNCNIQRVTN